RLGVLIVVKVPSGEYKGRETGARVTKVSGNHSRRIDGENFGKKRARHIDRDENAVTLPHEAALPACAKIGSGDSPARVNARRRTVKIIKTGPYGAGRRIEGSERPTRGSKETVRLAACPV